jgi:thiamine biosynthesis lipoprotein
MTLASDGMFNCTLGGLLVHRRILPDHGEGDPLDSGTAADIEIRGQAVRLIREVRVTLDGIAKGYAVDLAIRALRCGGVRLGWVNAGGDLRAFGALTLPVQRREADGSLRALGRLRDAAIATSVVRPRAGCRFPGRLLHVNGERPALGAFSVLARYAWRADALTKVAALAPVSSRRYLVTRLGGHLIEPEPDSPVVLERNTALRSRR